MWKLLLVLLSSVVNADNSVYRKVGDSVVLTPDAPVDPSAPISTIEWKHGPDLAVEWIQGALQCYRQFEDHCVLNISTGALTITGLMGNHSGRYEAMINNNKSTDSTRLLIIAAVSKPTVSKWCDLEMTFCLLTCEGNTTGAEPVTYRWLSGGKLVNSTKLLNITKENGERSFSCELENPVSSQSSDPMPNPFPTNESQPWDAESSKLTSRDRMWTLTCLIPFVVVGILCVHFFKGKKGQDDNGTVHESSPMILKDGQEPSCQEPPGQEPPGQEPPGQEPPGQEPPGQEPPGQEPSCQEPPGQEPSCQEPPGQEPSCQEPPGQEPSCQEPPGQEPSCQEPPGQEPSCQEPPGQEPSCQEPPGQEPSCQEPPGQEPSCQEPPGQEPSCQEPPGQESPGQEPSCQEPPGQEPPVDEEASDSEA